MASRSERFAAEAARRHASAVTPAAVVITEDTETMPIIRFASVTLHKALPRLDAGKGQATQSTTFFQALGDLTIGYDATTALVQLRKGDVCRYVPREGVEFFGPTVDDAVLEAKGRADEARRRVEANAQAERDATVSAAVPA